MLATVTDRKIRFAVVGCGRIAGNHFGAIAQHKDNIELVGVCDTNRERLKVASEATGTPGYGKLTAMLENSNPDIVVIASPSGLHAEHGP
jgi:UDP-N-acetyl-2-amino-2-deoxyglucuronate dehydrogenase